MGTPGEKEYLSGAWELIFDQYWYLEQNPDVKSSNKDPLDHFQRRGWKEGRDPHPLFVSSYYVSTAKGDPVEGNPLLHFMNSRGSLGSPNPVFDASWYAKTHSGVLDDYEDPLSHFIAVGQAAGLAPHPLVDLKFYVAKYPDVAASKLSPFEHLVRVGLTEDRTPTPLFDPHFYRTSNGFDIPDGQSSFEHFLNVGAKNRGRPHPLFDPDFYNLQLKTPAKNPLLHYVTQGHQLNLKPTRLFDPEWYAKYRKEIIGDALSDFILRGWEEYADPHPLFDVKWYLRVNPDVRRARVNPLSHFIQSGDRERRNPHPMFDSAWHSQAGGVAPYDCPMDHYLRGGVGSPHPLFDLRYFQKRNKIARNTTALEHYLRTPPQHRRPPLRLFDVEWYAGQLKGRAKVPKDLFLDFVAQGDAQGLSPHPLFNPTFYRSSNPSLEAAGVAPFSHYWAEGAVQGLSPNPVFDVEYYRRFNPDLKSQNPLLHYLAGDGREGGRRHTHPLFDGGVYAAGSPAGSNNEKSPLVGYLKHCSHIRARVGGKLPLPKAPIAKFIPAPYVGSGPLVSVVMPTYNSPVLALAAAINSVRSQTYANWELIIVDDGSTSRAHIDVIRDFAKLDKRIKFVAAKKNQGISGATNLGLEKAKGKFVALLDHDDIILNTAIDRVVRRLEEDDLDAVYTDQAYVDEHGRWRSAFHKPEWSPTMMTGVMYVGHLLVAKREILSKVGGLDSNFNRLQDFELMLRVGETTSRIGHVPEMLYQWRMIPGSIAADANAKGKIEPLQAEAVNAHLRRRGVPGEAQPHPKLPHRLTIVPRGPDLLPTEVLVRGDRPIDLIERCAGRLFVQAKGRWTIKLLPGVGPAMAELEEGLSESRADAVVYVDPYADPGDCSWLDSVRMHLSDPEVLLAGPHITDGKRILAAGYVCSPTGLHPAMPGEKLGRDGHAGSLSCDREVAALSGLAVGIRPAHLKGMTLHDPIFCESLYTFADLSLRAREQGLRTIAVVADKIAAAPENFAKVGWNGFDQHLFTVRHAKTLALGDPYFNANFAEPGQYKP